jgi:hypothetical protein
MNKSENIQVQGFERFGTFYTAQKEFFSRSRFLYFGVNSQAVFSSAGSYNTINGCFIVKPALAPGMQLQINCKPGILIESNIEILIQNKSAFNIGADYTLITAK